MPITGQGWELLVQRKGLQDYIDRTTKPAQPKATPGTAPPPPAAAGPPWEVPAECPSCGAPVDQAVASKDAQDRKSVV